MKYLQSISFLSDFGWGGGYVAACEATMVRLCRDVRVFHVSHEIPVGDVPAAALVLARVAPLYPESVHLAVVDPGVGTARRPLALAAARGDLLVGPDNGLLPDAGAALGGLVEGWALDVRRVRAAAGLPLEDVSHTFHGRDVFAPAAALLASGTDPSTLGQRLDLSSLVRPAPPSARREGDGVSAPVIEIDRFGNVGLGLPFVAAFLEKADVRGAGLRFSVEVEGEGASEWTARVVQTYGDLGAGELGLIHDSWGQAALALNGASAAEFLGVRGGTKITLTPAEESAKKASE